jgi:hypothetical protein
MVDRVVGASRQARILVALSLGLAVAIDCGSTEHPSTKKNNNRTNNYTGGPCAAGTIRSCHDLVGDHPGFIDCFNGTQECIAGAWGPCAGDPILGGIVVTHAIKHPALSGGHSLHAASLGAGAATASGAPCSLDPCNPYCVGFMDTTPVQPNAAACVAVMPDIPIAARGDNLGDCVNGAGKKDNQSCWFGNNCCAQMGSSWVCVDNADSGCKKRCVGADYTASLACDTAGQVHQWVCNQGSAASTSGSLLVQFRDPGAENIHASCEKNAWKMFGSCTIDLSKNPLASAGCIDVFQQPTPAGITCVDAAKKPWNPATALLKANFLTWVNVGTGEDCATGALPECSTWNNAGGIPEIPACTKAADCAAGYTCVGNQCVNAAATCPPSVSTCTDVQSACVGTKCKAVHPLCGGGTANTTNTYTMGACPVGTHGQWDNFAFSANPGKLTIAVQTSADGGTTWLPSFAAQTPNGAIVAYSGSQVPAPASPAPVPAAAKLASNLCPMNGPSPCPIDIGKSLSAVGPTAASAPMLAVNVTSPCSGSAFTAFQVTYSCTPNE